MGGRSASVRVRSRGGVLAVVLVAALLPVPAPAARSARAARSAPAAQSAPAAESARAAGSAKAAQLAADPGAPYRIGYASADVPGLAAANPDTGAALPAPVGTKPAEQASARAGGLVFVTHRPGHLDTDLAYRAPGTTNAVPLVVNDFVDRHPDLSPDGTLVAFESDRAGQFDIWVVGVDGTGLRRVTDHPAEDTWPTWSPNGDRIAFASNRDDPAGEIYTVARAGGATNRLTVDPAADGEPAWSPRGVVAFTTTRFRPAGGTDVATMGDTGGTVTRLVPGDQAAWSPDGGRLAYVTRGADPSGNISVLTVATRAVTTPAARPDRAETEPTWVGTAIAYTDVGTGDGTTDVWSADAAGGDRRDHTNRPDAGEFAPAYTVDGLRLAYSETNASFTSTRIVVAAADGSDPTPLTTFADNRADLDPAWSPDGTMIAFSRQVGEGAPTITIVRVADGQVLGTVPAPAGLTDVDDQAPAWSPDGQRVAFARRARVSPAQPITPGPVDRPLAPGGSTTVEQTVKTPVIPPTPDIVFVVDTTGSMDGVIAAIRQNIDVIVGRIHDSQPTAQFALVGYRGRGDVTEGYDAGFRLAMPLQAVNPDTPNNQLDQALAGFTSGGGNGQEDWFNALHRVATGGITFRPNSSRVVMLIGDAFSATDRFQLNPPGAPASQPPSITPELLAAGIRVVALPVATNAGEGGLNLQGQATNVTDYTGGVLLPETSGGGDPAVVTAAILKGLQNLPVTVTPTVQRCDAGLTVAFDPATPTTVTGGTDVRYRQTVTLAPGATPGATLRCTVEYRLSPNPGGAGFVVSIVVHATDPGLPVVTVDDVTVPAAGPTGAVVNYQATAVDRNGLPLTPVCEPPAGTLFPIGQTLVRCTAVDSAGRAGQDTALITVVDTDTNGSTRIWVATLDQPSVVTEQVDLSALVGQACPARRTDLAPAFSPDGASLAFAADGVLCVVDPAGGGARAVVTPAADTSQRVEDPAWSPDSTLIAYAWSVGSEGETVSIRTVPAAGGTPTTVIATPGDAFEPAFWPLSAGLALTAVAIPTTAAVGAPPIEVRFTARNTTGVPARRVFLATDAPTVAPQATFIGTLPPGGTAVVTVEVPTTAPLSGTAHGTLTGVFPENVVVTTKAEAALSVTAKPTPPTPPQPRVFNPALKLNPPLGPPGFVTLALGTGFPPGSTVKLVWSVGISAPTNAVVAGNGTFAVQMLVFHRDRLGPRDLVATGPGFAPVKAAFTVVPGTQQPDDFVVRR